MRNSEYMSREGAETLARRIRIYWAGKGVNISPEVLKEPDPTGRRENMYVVRSNLQFTVER